MNDRELLEFIAAQVGNLTVKVDGLGSELKEFKQETKERFDKLENQLTTIEVEHGKKLDALFDGYKQNTEAIKELSNKVDEVSDKVDRHDIKIQVIEGGKRA